MLLKTLQILLRLLYFPRPSQNRPTHPVNEGIVYLDGKPVKILMVESDSKPKEQTQQKENKVVFKKLPKQKFRLLQ